ncbi:hypothetical protein AMAG_09633 [Allomyces macrogynus ATCC 38327]|uniref:Uncharacterized protein n=1 Tax=Allomyces macrogynus (strain ATCC 38327) TaxID=578462 RepID=A0A0L0STC7_ALLM3|nr:hypothetical protein AMAG_09633 [Allomyces macrogynus ATCC 38327]|eukprot:KNE65650.1 hypothetical protein AMAG_09633 [Allomyces macrogynus ATCC 38327]
MDRDDAGPARPPARRRCRRSECRATQSLSPHASPSPPGTLSSATATDDNMDDENASIAHPDDAPPLPPAKRARHHRSPLDSLPAALTHARALADYLSPLPESAASHPTVRAAADELEALIPHITHVFTTAPALRVRAADVRSWIGTLQQTLSVDVLDAAPADLVLDVVDVVDQMVRSVGAVDVAYKWAIALLDIAQLRVEEHAEWMSDAEWCLVRAVDWAHWVLHAETDPDRLVTRTTTTVDRLLMLETTLHNDVLTLPSSTRPYLLHLILSLLHHTWYTAHRAAAHSPTFQHHWAATLRTLATDTDDLDLAHAALQRARMAVLLRSRPPAPSPSVDGHLLYARRARLVAKLVRSAIAGHATTMAVQFQLGETDPARFDDMAAVEYRKVLAIEPGHKAARKGLVALGRATDAEKGMWDARRAPVVAVRPVRVPRIAEVRTPVVQPLWPVVGEEEDQETDEDPDFDPVRADGEVEEEDELSDVTSSEVGQDDLADVAMDDGDDLDGETMDLDMLLDEYLQEREVDTVDGGGGGGGGGGAGGEDEAMEEDGVTVGDASEDDSDAMVEDTDEERAAAIWHGGKAG